MDSAVGAQLRSEASPAESITQSATVRRRADSARTPCWEAAHQAGTSAEAGAANILGSHRLQDGTRSLFPAGIYT